MKRKGLIGFLMGCLICILMALPSFVYANVTIDTAETSTVDLEGVNTTAGRNAYVIGPDGSVINPSGPAIWASVDGWSITVNSGRTVSATGGDGVSMHSGTIINSGLISSSTGDAIYLDSAGALTARIQNNVGGTIDGYYDGIYFASGGAGAATIANAGTITGNYGTGVYLWSEGAGTFVVNNTGTIQSYDNSDGSSGLYIGSDAGTGTATVTNSGTIQAYGDGVGIEYLDSATVTNNAGGKIESSWYNGVYIYEVGTTTINNSGTIRSYDDEGGYPALYIGYADTVTVNNNAGGNIQAVDGEGVYIEYANTATVNNYGTIQSSYSDGVYIDEFGTVTVNNYAGGLIQASNDNSVYIADGNTATVNNYGTITSGCERAIGIYDVGTATINNYAGGLIQATEEEAIEIEDTEKATVNNYGRIEGVHEAVYINNVGTATVTNSGTILSYTEDAIYIGNSDAAKVTNNGTITSTGGSGIFIYVGGEGTTTVTNTLGGVITAYNYGIYVENDGPVTVTNSGTILTTDEDGIYVLQYQPDGPVTVTNSGYISASNDDYGIYVDGWGTTNVTNSGQIMATNGYGIYIENDGTTNVTNSGTIMTYYEGIEIYNTGTVNVTNSGTIISQDSDGVYIGGTGAKAVTNNAGGSISGDRGVRINNSSSDDVATITNAGTITGTQFGIYLSGSGEKEVTNSGIIRATNNAGILLFGDGDRMVTNNAGGLIEGVRGIGGNDEGVTTILNHGTITGTGGLAIALFGNDNEVTLGTGSVINGNILAVNAMDNNRIILDGQGTIDADQIRRFAYLNKTGAGTWILTGDMDYSSSYNYNGHSITVEEGILALAARGSIGGGVVTDEFTQLPGASLGFVVTATGSSGALSVNSSTTANFNNGTIVVIPKAGGIYPATTIYENVLTFDTDPEDSARWLHVTSTSAFLSPTLIADEDYVHNNGNESYDLRLIRLSFSTGALNSSLSLGIALDGMYEDATGDMRTILDELIVLGPGAAQTALAQLGGGTHTAFQFMSFEGLSKYLGALSGHLGGGSGFAGGAGKAMAYNQNGYFSGVQLVMASGGNTMSDTAPMLAALGNLGQIASGTKWNLWTDGYYSRGDRSSDDIISKYNSTLYGALMGFDYRATDNLLIGVSAGISQAEVKFDDLMDEGRMDSYQGSVYTYYDAKPWYVEGVLTYAYNAYKMDRWITTGGTWLANAEYSGNEFAGYAEVGYKLDVSGIVMIRPMAGFQAAYLMQDGFTETGAGDLNLVVDSQDTGSYQSYLGVHVSKAIAMGRFVLTPDARVKWAHEFSPDDHLINARFSGAGSGSFTVEADRPSRDTAIVGLGLNGRFNKNLSVYIQYDAELNRDFTNHTGMLGARFEW